MVKKDDPIAETDYTRWVNKTLLLGEDGTSPADADNPVPVSITQGVDVNIGNVDIETIHGVVSTDNSTTALLGPNSTFTGVAEDITNYGAILLSVYADQPSATDGLVAEFSPDGINWDNNDTFTMLQNETYTFQPAAQFFRVRYTNGSTGQGEFRLQTIFKSVHVKSSTHRIGDDISSEDDSELSTTVIKTIKPDGTTYSNIDTQHPLPADGDSVYEKDIKTSVGTTIGTFTGDILSLFNNLDDVITDSTTTNPKYFEFYLERPVNANSFGLNTSTGDFSNVKIILKNRQGVTILEIDDTANSTKYTNRSYPFNPKSFCCVRIEFHTTDTVNLSGVFIQKEGQVAARIQAIKPDGTLTSIGATNNDNLKVSVQEYGDTPSIDAFDRLRTSEPFTIFDSKQLFDKQPLFWDEDLGGSATSTHSVTDARTRLSVTANAADYVIRQTKQWFNYQPGKSQLILITFQGSQTTGLTKRVGLFNGTGTNNLTPNNGIFFETDGSVSWNIAKNGTTTETVTQSNWNVDPLDGTGPSGITLDFNATQIAIIDFEWLGVGRVRVGFVIDGLIYYVHYFNHANDPTFTSVYMSTPNLPLRYDIQTDGTTAGDFDHICSSVMSEGGIEKTGVLRVADTGSDHVDASTANTIYAVVGIRLKTNYLGITVIPEAISMVNENNDDFRWSLCLNPTVNGTFTYSDLTDSAVQTATGSVNNNTVSDENIVISSGYASIDTLSTDAQLQTALKIGSQIDGTRDELVLCVTPLSGGADIQGSLNFRELL